MKDGFFENLKKTFKVIFQKRANTEEDRKGEKRNKIIVYCILSVVSIVLTILNIVNQKDLIMTISTGVLFGICIICVLIVWKTKNRVIPDVLLSISIGFIFSYYAVAGQNEGFAILWIVLVPAVGMLLLSYKAGLIISTYFLLLLIIIFYTPLKDMIPAIAKDPEHPKYTATFMIRFPLLYLADFLTAIVLTSQKVYYLNKAQNIALYDQMTGLRNRRYFVDLFEEYEKDGDKMSMDTTVVFFDLNNLKYINDKFGHNKGDDAIRRITLMINKYFADKTDYIYRMGGDEFTVVFEDKENQIADLITAMKKDVGEQLLQGYKLSVSVGYVKKRDYINDDFATLINISEKNMYQDKEEYYKKNKGSRYRGGMNNAD